MPRAAHQSKAMAVKAGVRMEFGQSGGIIRFQQLGVKRILRK